MSINYLKVPRSFLIKFFCYMLIFITSNHWCFGESSKSYLKNINPDSLRLKSINAYRTADKIEINGVRYEGSCVNGSIDLGVKIRVTGKNDFGLIVEEVSKLC